MQLNLCEILSDTGKLPIPLGGYKLPSLKLWRLNNLTHKRLREGCVDWKSIGCPQPHMSLSQRWHQHFFKRGNRFSLQGLFLESACMNPVQNKRIIPSKSWTFQRHHSFTNARYFFLLCQSLKIHTWLWNRGNKSNQDPAVDVTETQFI